MKAKKSYTIVDSVERLEQAIASVRAAQREFATFSQEQVDKIFLAAATAANAARIPLAKLAVAETGMGVMEDKVIKNHFAAEYIYNKYRDEKTCGIIERDEAFGYTKYADPIGVIAAVIPTTNPTSTAIFKSLLALKTRNGIIFSPHPRAKGCTIAAARLTEPLIYEDYIEVSEDAAARINAARERGGCVIAVGTTSVRTLESSSENGKLLPGKGDTQIFIRPGYQ